MTLTGTRFLITSIVDWFCDQILLPNFDCNHSDKNGFIPGIFISRISLPSLAPVLSVGDEIIFVEDEVVKGQDLEYVQTLIAGKSSVKIVLLPTVGAVA